MGDTGPCGPCSEIFYDHGDHIPGGPPGSPDEDGDRFIEIWNLVFMQYRGRSARHPRRRCRAPRSTPAWGWSAFAAILQGKHDNYDTDTLRALILASAEATGQDPDGPFKTSHRVIADHLRSSAFLMADGVLPSNEGRGYVLRRIMRRAMRHATMMGAREPVMYRLVPALVRQMGAAYPELVRAEALIAETLMLEETRFKQLLDRGLHLLAEETEPARRQAGPARRGRVPAVRHLRLPARPDAGRAARAGPHVDLAGFEAAMQEQRVRARAAWAGSGEAATERVWFEIKETRRRHRVPRLRHGKRRGRDPGARRQAVPRPTACPAGTDVAVVLNQTPFYGESGGQVGDTGIITGPDGLRHHRHRHAEEARRPVRPSRPRRGRHRQPSAPPVVATVDHARRTAIRAHHSATHLLHEALRRKLGTHVQQKGSLNAPDRLRFDVSQPRPITADELRWVEAEVNARIRENSEVTTRLMTPDAAVELGAMALFGEKYGDEVRVVAMGAPDGNKAAWSIELCGGTHVRRTGDIGYFRIVGESAVAAGVRRIEAVTGAAAEAVVAEIQARLNEAAGALRAAPAEVPERIIALQETDRKLQSAGGRFAEEARHRRRRRGGRGGRRHQAVGPQHGRRAGARPEGPGGGDRQAAGIRRRGAGVDRRGQGQHRGRRLARPDRAVQRGRPGARGLGGGRRQGRRRPAGSGAGGRSRRRESGRGAGGGAGGVGVSGLLSSSRPGDRLRAAPVFLNQDLHQIVALLTPLVDELRAKTRRVGADRRNPSTKRVVGGPSVSDPYLPCHATYVEPGAGLRVGRYIIAPRYNLCLGRQTHKT